MYLQRTISLLADIHWQMALNDQMCADLHCDIHLLKKPLCGYPQHAPEIAAEIGFVYIVWPYYLPQCCICCGYRAGTVQQYKH